MGMAYAQSGDTSCIVSGLSRTRGVRNGKSHGTIFLEAVFSIAWIVVGLRDTKLHFI